MTLRSNDVIENAKMERAHQFALRARPCNKGFMRISGLALLASFLSVAAPVNAAEEAVVLSPVSRWHLDYGEQTCRLARIFQNGSNRHILFFDQFGPGDSFGMTAAGPAFASFRTRGEVTLGFGTEINRTNPFYLGEVPQMGTALIFGLVRVADGDAEAETPDEERTELPAIDLKAVHTIDHIRIEQGKRIVKFETGNLEEPFEALNNCSQSLLTHWGLDLDRHRKVTRYPQWTNLEQVADAIVKDYPSPALRKGEMGIVRMRLIIDANGKVETCETLNSTVLDTLKSPACVKMRKARFKPAVDASGKPMRSYYITSIMYHILGG